MSGADFERVIAAGGVVLFPSDTVYGLACDPSDATAVARLYALKGRAPDKAAALMFFDLEAMFAALPLLGQRSAGALRRLLPGPITVLIDNPDHRYPLSARADPDTLGLRVVCVPALKGARGPVLQSSANPSGGADAACLAAVDPAIRAGADLVVDGGTLPGVASTVVDLRGYEAGGQWRIVRQGAVSAALIESLLNSDYVFEPSTYDADVICDVHDYDELQAQLVAGAAGPGEDGPAESITAGAVAGAAGPREDGPAESITAGAVADGAAAPDGPRPSGAAARGMVRQILELGTGTGVSAARLLDAFPDAVLTGLDATPGMLAYATGALDPARFRPRLGLLQEALPAGPFELVASALAVHHLCATEKRELFTRVFGVLSAGGRLVLADVIVPEDPSEAVIELEPGFDQPSSLREQVGWLLGAGFRAVTVPWLRGDLAVIVAVR